MNMSGKLITGLFASGLLALTALPANAHHAFSAEFDAE
jgi:hypothetical protein